MSDDNKERRHFTRIPFDANIYLSKDGNVWKAKLLDISLKGLLSSHPSEWRGNNGDIFTIELPLGPSDAVITVSTKVVHITDEHIGFSFEQMELESASHLKRLLELNIGDESLLERELTELINLHSTDSQALH